MKLRRIALEQVRKFEGRVVVEGIADGLNLVVGANETGKTTLLAGLRAGLFLKHTSSRARELQHHRHRTAPRVELEFESDHQRLVLEKRFLQRPQATLRTGGTTLTGEAAEQAFQTRLSGGAQAHARQGLWNLLLVGQGESAEHAVEADARGLLQASLEAQLDSVTGGGSAKRLIGRLDERLFGQKGLIDRRNQRPKGRLRDLELALAGQDDRLRTLNERRERLTADVERLGVLLAAQAGDHGRGDAQEREIAAREAEEAGLLRQQDAAAVAARAALALNEAQARLGERQKLITELRAAVERLEAYQLASTEANDRLDRARTEGEALALQKKQGDAILEAANAWQQATGEAEQMLRGAAAGATEVTFDLAEDVPPRLRLNGQAPRSRRFRIRVSEQLTVDAESLGRITIRPAQAEDLRRTLDEIQARVDAAGAELDRLGVAGTFDFTSPAAVVSGLDRLRQARADLAQQLEDARGAFRDARHAADRAARDCGEALGQQTRLEEELAAARVVAPDDALEAAAASALAALPEPLAGGSADASLQALETVRARLKTLRRQRDEAQRHRAEVDKEIAVLGERIATLQGTGLKEEVDEALRRRTHLEQEHAALEREVAVASLLRATLIEAEQEVRESYTAPLVARLQPALDELLPGARVTLDDNLHIIAVERDQGGEEAFAQLSHGTREQLAVIARLAFAEILIDSGQPCFVVLDDALVFSDDERLERMCRILERAAERIQILVLTCRERAFSGLRANRLRIETAAPATV